MSPRCFRWLAAASLTLALAPISLHSQTVTPVAGGAQLDFANYSERVQFYGDDAVRVLKWPKGGSPDKASLIVLAKEAVASDVQMNDAADAVTIAFGPLSARVSKKDGAVSFVSGAKTLLSEQGAPAFTPSKIAREEKAYAVAQRFALTADEGLFGLGQHQTSDINWRGKTVKLVQSNTDAVSPVLVSSVGYGILWDNYSKTIFDDRKDSAGFWSEVADNVDYYFMYAGGKIDGAIACYRKLSGAAPMYGKWAYGYWQSKEHYHTQDEILAVGKKYRDLRLPIDNIVQDWNYWDGLDNWGSMVFDSSRYPDPKKMFETLHNENYHTMLVIWAALGPKSQIHKDMDKNGWLFPTVGWAGFKYFDVYNPQANDLYWKYASNLLKNGFDAWWMDSTEPDMVNALTKESEEFEMKRVADNHLGTFARYLNPYSLLDTDSIYNHQRAESDKKRVFILTRSTFAGQQRSGAATWSGDIGSSWEVFRKQIPAGVNHSMAGLPYWTFDIGGYTLACQGGRYHYGAKDPAYQEFYTRMYQFGAFSPIFRSHGSNAPREIWEFPEYEKTLVKYDNLRYRLLPYIYTQAWRVTAEGSSLMRGLAMDFAADKKTYDVNDEYMFGPSILVAPVAKPVDHREPAADITIDAKLFKTPDGKPGLKATYFCDDHWGAVCHQAVEPGVNLFWYTGWPEFIKEQHFSMRWEGKLTPAASGAYLFDLKSFGDKLLYIDGKLVETTYKDMEAWTAPVELIAGKSYDFKFETKNSALGAFRAIVTWKTPKLLADDKLPLNVEKKRDVYLPAGAEWFDFWTGDKHAGGQTLAYDAPVDTMPLNVRAGSILPMGPFLQYSTERPADPIELRVYPGADGDFVLYEDENDTYNYEKGLSATIAFHWNDAKRELTIGERKGTFPGMLIERDFHVVIVGKGHGVGLDVTPADKLVRYNGEAQSVTLQ